MAKFKKRSYKKRSYKKRSKRSTKVTRYFRKKVTKVLGSRTETKCI